jgi:hypothetical protein
MWNIAQPDRHSTADCILTIGFERFETIKQRTPELPLH